MTITSVAQAPISIRVTVMAPAAARTMRAISQSGQVMPGHLHCPLLMQPNRQFRYAES